MAYLEKAINLATKLHKGQKDKCGEPYILHPLRVMMTVQSDLHRSVAVLHDVLEDTDMSEDNLLKFFPFVVVKSVVAMTKIKGESYENYLKRICLDHVARTVKIADVKDNASPSRLYRLDPSTIARLTKKYSTALKVLEGW